MTSSRRARVGDFDGAGPGTIAAVDERIEPGGRERLEMLRVAELPRSA